MNSIRILKPCLNLDSNKPTLELQVFPFPVWDLDFSRSPGRKREAFQLFIQDEVGFYYNIRKI